jgi:hypothetical protein
VAAHELGAAAYAIKAAPAAATEDERVEAGRLECQWQRAQLRHEIRELVLDDQRLRNELCWFAFDGGCGASCRRPRRKVGLRGRTPNARRSGRSPLQLPKGVIDVTTDSCDFCY